MIIARGDRVTSRDFPAPGKFERLKQKRHLPRKKETTGDTGGFLSFDRFQEKTKND
jgi:hypothetical protein